MPTTEPNTVSLPLLPIEVGVVLPNMVVTLAPDTDESRQAVQAASTADGLLLLVPRIDGRYAKVGTVARVDEVGQLPNGQQAVLLRMDPGAHYPSHVHPGGEDVYVIEGSVQLGADRLGPGDYLYTPPGGITSSAAAEKVRAAILLP